MSYKQHNSPFNKLTTPNSTGSVYSSPNRTTQTFGNEAATLGKKTLDFVTDMETALGTTTTEDLTNTDEEVATNAPKGALANTGEVSAWEKDYAKYGQMTTRSGALARKANNKSLPPRIRASADRKLRDQQLKEKLQEERNFGEGGRNERHGEMLRIKEEKKLQRIKERNSNKRDKVRDKVDETFTSPAISMYEKQQNNMKQINSRGSAFPMVNPDMTDPTVIPPNRAGGGDNRTLTQGTSIADQGLKPASQVPINNTFSDLSSSVGEVNQSMNPMAPGQENTQDQIAQAQENLGTDAATNTPPNTMGSAGMGMFAPPPESKKEKNLLRWVGDKKKDDAGMGGGAAGLVLPGKSKGTNMQGPAKKDWIQDVNKDIEKRGTKGVCTGSKFGSDSCPPDSKRYNLAKTFKKMNK